ncbi:DNA alkylation repair protein [Haliangium sp.]|uniref:DNA alkylation repair protein n=1 Tax=Haliangium sp. TaxID=2663208 RepID=UPI003D0EE92E
MADDRKLFKDSLDRGAVKRLAKYVHEAQPGFDQAGFVRRASRGLADLEMKARVRHIASVLRAHLPEAYLDALAVLVRAGAAWRSKIDDDPAGFAAWPLIEFVGWYGLDHASESLEALRGLTGLFSAEFAIRPFIEQDQAGVLARLATWTADADHYVRRLVSEGTRPRLPWAGRLRALQEEPRPALALLERLRDDESAYVRRSVANHLNDVAKDHAELVVALCERWSRGADGNRQALIRHALRTLIKAGHPGAMAVLGFDPKAEVDVETLAVSPKRIALGEEIRIHIELVSRSRRTQKLVVDYAIHHVKKNGSRTAKVFKLRTLTLTPGQRVALDKVHGLREITTRRYHSGRHAVEVLVNGHPRSQAEFDLRVPR